MYSGWEVLVSDGVLMFVELLSATGRNEAGPPGSSSGIYVPSVVRFLEVVTVL